jgi:hypothetical protein
MPPRCRVLQRTYRRVIADDVQDLRASPSRGQWMVSRQRHHAPASSERGASVKGAAAEARSADPVPGPRSDRQSFLESGAGRQGRATSRIVCKVRVNCAWRGWLVGPLPAGVDTVAEGPVPLCSPIRAHPRSGPAPPEIKGMDHNASRARPRRTRGRPPPEDLLAIDQTRRQLWRAFQRGELTEPEFVRDVDRLEARLDTARGERPRRAWPG